MSHTDVKFSLIGDWCVCVFFLLQNVYLTKCLCVLLKSLIYELICCMLSQSKALGIFITLTALDNKKVVEFVL